MSERKNIWDILSDKQLNIEQEYLNLWKLVSADNQVTRYERGYTNRYSLHEIISNNFIDFRNRGTFIAFNEFLNYLELQIPNSYNPLSMVVTIDTLNLLIEIILLVFSELDDLNYGYNYGDIRGSISQNIELILQKSNQKVVEIEKGKQIIVPNDETVTAVSELILPDDEKLALSILGYSHYANKDNISVKDKILNDLHKYLKSKFEKIDNSNIEYVFNNLFLRHGKGENKARIDMLGVKAVNSLYDALFREVLYFMLGKEHENFTELIKGVKKEVGDARG
ncbi:hypothetical protein [Lactococcus cremoris]|uniref:Uncharacterized protein n=1 Tax=Lactococcus lactis subsp. cremoris TaxID=1359 RepID=A0AAX4AJG8_LACLC|nr:hypothetical protein [Lactococcus cremoris]KGH33841.1 hypothetical protein JL36_03485 [Lactococcus cremoris]QSE64229.1 hypothetical protein JWR96_03645 [Lactococcus cremoris]WMX69846.1 hypothetical protein RF668_08060 [Lactococcus cremoris]